MLDDEISLDSKNNVLAFGVVETPPLLGMGSNVESSPDRPDGVGKVTGIHGGMSVRRGVWGWQTAPRDQVRAHSFGPGGRRGLWLTDLC
jgi:hypothetical protein